MYLFLGDSILGSIRKDVFDQIFKKNAHLNLSKNGICLQDLVKAIPAYVVTLQSHVKHECTPGVINVIVTIGTNDMCSYPSVLSEENMRIYLLSICSSIRHAFPETMITFIGLASRPSHCNRKLELPQCNTDAESLQKRRRVVGCPCNLCGRESFSTSFNESLKKITSECNCLYLISPTKDGSTWCWKDSTHVDESEHLRYLQGIFGSVCLSNLVCFCM
jgi:hypothetical protein